MRTTPRTLHTSLHMGSAAAARHPRRPASVRRAVWAVLACRTAELGGHIPACPAGPIERVWSNSCRHRMGPPWAGVQVARGLAQPQARLLAGDHDQVIGPMPQELTALWLATVAVLTTRLFARGHDPWCARWGAST